ncbi:MAG: hypothetical protein M1608_03330 [Candidatus Omnitrophica bacterium]|nr:hypothetical protein [Candidatus Omnitrophota bacterium]
MNNQKSSPLFNTARLKAILVPILAVAVGWAPSLAPAYGQSPTRVVRASDMTVQVGQTNYVDLELESQGDENALSFSLNFDPAVLRFDNVVEGSGEVSLLLNVITNQIGSGRVGLAVALRSGLVFAPGTQELAKIGFEALATTSSQTTSVTFGDQPMGRQVIDTSGQPLSTSYLSGTVTLIGPPRYRLTLAAVPAGLGFVEADPLPGADGKYAAGTAVNLTAVAASGYQFANWIGNPPSEVFTPEWVWQNPLTCQMTDDKELTATFTQIPLPPAMTAVPERHR